MLCTRQIHLKTENIIELSYCVINLIFHNDIQLLVLPYFYIHAQEIMCVTSAYNHVSKVIINFFQDISNQVCIYMQEIVVINIL